MNSTNLIGRTMYFWKTTANVWFLVSVVIFTMHFFSGGIWDAGASMVSIIYPAVLTIYAGEKEITRWKTPKYVSRFSGESIIVLWTVLLIGFAIISTLSGGQYNVSWEMVTTYLAVLSIFAITMKSKDLRAKRP